MAKRKKKGPKRVKREPPPPKWLIFKSFNQTKEEVYFGVSKARPKWEGNKSELRGVPELAHWDLEYDKIMIIKIHKRKRFATQEDASRETRAWERGYDHWRNFWVIQTGSNKLLPPRLRKPIKPPRLPPGYYFDSDLSEEEPKEMNDALHEEADEDGQEEDDNVQDDDDDGGEAEDQEVPI